MSEIRNPRRYALYKRRAAAAVCDHAIADVWAAKHAELPGTLLPADFPHREKLSAALYTAFEDLSGADECELTEQGFTTREAAQILAALA